VTEIFHCAPLPARYQVKDMVLGCYLTTNLLVKKLDWQVGSTLTNLMGSGLYYSNREEALRVMILKKLIYILISGWKWNNSIENGMDKKNLEIRVDYYGNWRNF
jgi:hypothetical protein